MVEVLINSQGSYFVNLTESEYYYLSIDEFSTGALNLKETKISDLKQLLVNVHKKKLRY